MPRPWRQEIELLQNYPKHKTFTFTTTSGSAQEALDVDGNFEEINKISFVVELADAYVAFDETADKSVTPIVGMLIPANEGYFDDSVYLGSKITVQNFTNGQNVRIRGIIWGR